MCGDQQGRLMQRVQALLLGLLGSRATKLSMFNGPVEGNRNLSRYLKLRISRMITRALKRSVVTDERKRCCDRL